MTLGSDVFSIRPTRIWPMKLFLISRDITPTLFLTRSRLRISNSLATVNKEYQIKNNRKDGPNICLETENLPRVGAHKGSSGKYEQKLCFLTIGKQDLDPLLMLVHQKGLIFFRGDNKIKTQASWAEVFLPVKIHLVTYWVGSTLMRDIKHCWQELSILTQSILTVAHSLGLILCFVKGKQSTSTS